MLTHWFRDRRRQKLADEPFPAPWLDIIHANCRHFPKLPPPRQQRLLRDARWFLAEKEIQPAAGMTVTDEIRVTIAAHVALIGLGFETPPFSRLGSVIVRPESYALPTQKYLGGGLNIVENEARIGEVRGYGPVVLSWEDIAEQCRDTPYGRNVILHEFAHLLDMENGEMDGIPPMQSDEEYRIWTTVTRTAYEELVEAARNRTRTLLDWYGATNPVEFFAVATESFFEQALEFQTRHPDLYHSLSTFYRQNPAEWQTSSS